MKRIKSQRPGNGKREDSLTSDLARPAMILEERDVIELLRTAVGRERSQPTLQGSSELIAFRSIGS